MAKIQWKIPMRAYVGTTSTLTFKLWRFPFKQAIEVYVVPREGIMGVLTMLAYVNSVSPSCVYFITISRLRKQTSDESEHRNQNQNQKAN